MYWVYDFRNMKTLKVCESQTQLNILQQMQVATVKRYECVPQQLIIRPDVFYEAYHIQEKEHPECKQDGVTVLYNAQDLQRGAERLHLSALPVRRVYFIECGNFPPAIPIHGYNHENIFIEFNKINNESFYNNLSENVRNIFE